MRKKLKNTLMLSGASALAVLAVGTVGTSVKASSKITITVANWEGQSTSLTDEHLIAKEYMRAHPNINIQIDSIPSNYGTKILTEIAAGDAPDIMEVGDGDVAMYAQKGAIINLTPYIQAAHINLKDYYPSVLNTGRVGGHVYTMPKDWSNLAIYYNKVMFKKAHVPFPTANWTWQQLFIDAKKLTKVSGGKTTQWGIVLPGAWNRGFEPLLYGFGGTTIGPNGKYMGYMNGKGSVAAVKFYSRMYQAGVTPSPATIQGFQGVDVFQAKKAAMNMTGIWPLKTYQTTPDFNFGVAPIPKGPAGYGNAICYAGYGIYSGSPHKQAAFDFLKFLTGVPGETIQSNYAFVSLYSVAKNTHQTNNPYLQGFLKGVPYIHKLGSSIDPNYVSTGSTNFTNALNTILLKPNSNVQQVLTQAAKLSVQQNPK